jgi:hypothetical protein
VRDGRSDALLEKDRDYTLSYYTNTEPPTGAVIITGMGNYTGELIIDFTIVAPYTPPEEPPGPPEQPLYPVDTTWTRLYGPTRYQTMDKIVRKGWTDANAAIIATGENFPDALAGGAFNGRSGSVLLLAAENSMGTFCIDAIVKAHHLEIGTGYFLGSETVVPQSLAAKFQAAAKGQ